VAPRPFTVGEVLSRARDLLEAEFRFPLLVVGEVSGVRQPRGGHLYFTLRDSRAQLRIVVFSRDVPKLAFPVEDGAKLVVRGFLTAFVDAGNLQLRADWVEPQGVGERAVRLEALKRRLRAEGAFDTARKRALPFLPRTIGLVTSPTGAAIRDVLSTIDRRCPRVRVVLSPVRVSGGAAAAEVARALADLDRLVSCDLVIVARGGGSREDLECFDEEVVCRAILSCRSPVVTGIGHETDVSVADLVADLRAPTPTAAAELAVPELATLEAELGARASRLVAALRTRVELARRRVDACERSFGFRAPREQVRRHTTRLSELEARLERAVRTAIERRGAALATAAGQLDSLSPLKVLARGFSLTTRAESNEVVRDAATLSPGEEILTRVARGRIRSRVLESGGET
jgi:exodeoxyribonuclease VII large subunit